MYKKPLVIGCMKLGSWGANYSTKELTSFVDGCLDLDLNEFDHADIYGGHTTEAAFGEVLKKRPDLRNKINVTTKCGIAFSSEERPGFQIKHYNSTGTYITTSIDQSLQNLKVDKIDTFLIHRPDFLSNPAEIAEAISKAKEEGKIIHFGVSNYLPHQLDILASYLDITTHQIEISVTHLTPFEDGSLQQLMHKSIQPTAWSPLGGGTLFTHHDTRSQRIKSALDDLGAQYGLSQDQLLIAWLRKHPAGIIPVLGTSKVSRIQSALEACSAEISHEDWYKLWVASKGHEVA